MKSIGEEIRRLERFVARGKAEQALQGYERLQARLPRDPVIRGRVSFLRDSVHRHAPEWQVRTYVISPRAVAEAHIMAGRYADALEVLASLLELQPEDNGLARRVAMVRAMRDGRQDAGIETTASTHVMSPEMLVEAQLAAGEVGAALRVLRSMAARRPGDTRLHERVKALAEAWDTKEEISSDSANEAPAPIDPSDQGEDLPTLDSNAFDEIGATELDTPEQRTLRQTPATGSPPPHDSQDQDSLDEIHRPGDLDTQVLEGLMKDARAVIQDYDAGTASPVASISSVDVDVLDTLPEPEAETIERPSSSPARRPVPTSQRPATAVVADGAEIGGLLDPVSLPRVRITRRQSSPERVARGSVDDLRAGDPHAGAQSKLLGISQGPVEVPRSGAFDIHEMLTETGTNPSIALDSVFAPSPSFSPPPEQEPTLASPDDFDDESTVADGFGGDSQTPAHPPKGQTLDVRPTGMRFAEDLLDEADDPTVLDKPPLAAELPEHEQETVIRKPDTKPKPKSTATMRRHKKK